MSRIQTNQNFCTPYLHLDVQKLQQNIERFARHFSEIRLRPHIKTHKCAEIAHLQLKAGAAGICVATVAEAEAMAAQGINDIFMAYPLVGKAAADRFFAIAGARLATAFDSIFHLEELKKHAARHAPFRVRLEINSGQNRCGILPTPQEIAAIAEYLQKNSEFFELEGVFSHAGQVYRCENSEQIRKIAAAEEQAVAEAALFLRRLGFACPIVSTGTTPTALFTANKLVNECRPGNYVFNDAIQFANSTTSLENCALSIISRVIGRYSDHLVIDAGSKALGLDRGAHGLVLVNGYGLIKGYDSLCISSLSEEHGIVTFSEVAQLPEPGQLLEIIPNHSCAAANMFSQYHVFEAERFLTTWPLIGRR